jgi:hypothetical protein
MHWKAHATTVSDEQTIVVTLGPKSGHWVDKAMQINAKKAVLKLSGTIKNCGLCTCFIVAPFPHSSNPRLF